MLLSYLKVGFIGFGGGSALIPVIEKEVVKSKKLLQESEYHDHVIVSNITPGTLPVKLAAAGGYRICGWPGMLLAAIAVSIPGVLGTVLILSALSLLDLSILRHIEMLAVGIAVFIIFLLITYIQKVMNQCKQEGTLTLAVIIMLAVALLTGGKEFYTLIGLQVRPIFDLSTINILILAFFIIFYTCGDRSPKRTAIATALSLLFLLLAAKRSPITPSWVLPLQELVMLALAARSVYSSYKAANVSGQASRAHSNGLLMQLFCWVLFLLTANLPMLFFIPGSSAYLIQGLLSSVMSFGGGEAYLTVADGIFVSGGMVTSDVFYSQLLPVANALPGPILSKILAGVGYYFGFSKGGTVEIGYLVALSGYAASLASTCFVFFLVLHLYHRTEQLPAFQVLKKWMLPIICGLLISTMLSMLTENISICSDAGVSPLIVLLIMCSIYGIAWFLHTKFRLHDILLILFCGGLSWFALFLL